MKFVSTGALLNISVGLFTGTAIQMGIQKAADEHWKKNNPNEEISHRLKYLGLASFWEPIAKSQADVCEIPIEGPKNRK